MTASKAFLEKLLLKLKTGNARSIHLNALPGRFARLDLYELINIDQSLHLKFIYKLLSKTKFKFNISVDFKIIQKKSDEEVTAAKKIVKKLNGLFYQQQDEYLEHGTKTFAFGYPLLIKKDPSNPQRILKAPLIIWYLNLEKDAHKSNNWSISRTDESPIIFNEVLRSHIETHERIKIDDILVHLDDQLIDENELTTICKKTLTKLGTTASDFDEELKVLPGTNRESIEKLTQEDPWIRWSGIFGLYKTQKQSVIKDIQSLIKEPIPKYRELIDETVIDRKYRTLSIVPMDPSQERILYKLQEENKVVIQGPPGTGKSQTISSIISNALLKNQTSLIVCEKRTALEVIYQNLVEADLADLCIIIDDVHRDRKKVVDKIRGLLENRNEVPIEFRKHEFEESLNAFDKNKSDINHQIKYLNTKCFGDDHMIGVIAKRQRFRGNAGPIELKSDSRLISLKYENYNLLVNTVTEACEFFNKISVKSFVFDFIDKRHFLNDEFEPSIFIPDILDLLNHTERLIEIIERSHKDYGNLFDEIKNKWKVNLGAFALKKYKSIKQSHTLIYSEWSLLKEHIKDRKYFPFNFRGLDVIQRFTDLLPNLITLQSKLEPLYNNRDTFTAYIPWRKYIEQQPLGVKYLLIDLSQNIQPEFWENAYSVWFLGEFIEMKSKQGQLKGNTVDVQTDCHRFDDELKRNTAANIASTWEDVQKRAFKKRTIQEVKNLYNYRRNKSYGRRNSLRKIIQHDFELFVKAFPVVMVNPTVCSSILPLKENLFDQVVFDEASQLRIEDTYAALIRGTKKIVSGDKHQMPPSGYFHAQFVLVDDADEEEEDSMVNDEFLAESESLLEYCEDTDYESTYLDFHYRSKHPDLIQFSNNAFYGGRLIPMPALNNEIPISYFNVKGQYLKSRTNLIEAKALVDYVFKNIRERNGQYPSVGIATFNLNQRNLIWDLLMQRTYENEDAAKKLDSLIEKGLFVKNLENVQGDERDIMFISTTFGQNKDGNFKQLFGPLTQAKGYQLMNVIITRAKERVCIFTSIPETFSSKYADAIKEKGNTGKGILYAYLHYAQAVSDNNSQKKSNLLELVNNHCRERHYKHEFKGMSAFHQLLFKILLEKFDTNIVKHNEPFGGFNIELCLLQQGKPKIAIITEVNTQYDETAYRMLLYKQDMLTNFGIKTYFIAALDWFKNWDQEANKMLTFIEQNIH